MSFLGAHAAALLHGCLLTVVLAAASWLLALVVGLALALLRMSGAVILEYLVIALVEYQRNVPPLVHIFLWYFGVSSLLPQGLQDFANAHHGEVYFSVIAIGLYYGAYISEDIRSGLRSIPAGQMEAARALGLSYFAAMRRVIVPQALRAALPPLTSEAVLLLKTTSLAMVVGAKELSYVTQDIANRTFQVFDAYASGTAMYAMLALSVLGLGAWLSRRLQPRGP